MTDWSSDKIKFTYDSDSPQIIILSEIFHPGWKILNSEIEVIRINGLFRAIIIPEGKKDIIMQYKPIDLIVGKWISIFSYMVIIFLAFVSYRRKNV